MLKDAERSTGLAGTFSYPTDLEDNLVGCVAFQNGALGSVIHGAWFVSITVTRTSALRSLRPALSVTVSTKPKLVS